MTSPIPIASRPRASEAPARVNHTMPAETASPIIPLSIAAKRTPPNQFTMERTATPSTKTRLRGSLTHWLTFCTRFFESSLFFGVQRAVHITHHKTNKAMVVARCCTDLSTSFDALSGPQATRKSSVRVAAAKDRSVMTGTGRRISGKIAKAMRPHKTPGVVMTSGITR